MEAHLTQEAKWAAGVAGRLRLVQASLSDKPPAERQGHLAEELESALKSVPPSGRRVHLEALAEKFPAWQVAALPELRSQSKPDVIEDTPELRLESLLQVAARLPPEQLELFSRKLKQAGFKVVEGSGPGLELPADFRKKLNLQETQALSPERAGKLLAETLELALRLDLLVGKTWRELSPNGKARPAGELRTLAARYLAGDGEVSTPQVSASLEQLRKLTAAMLGGIPRGALEFARGHWELLSPEAIEGFVEMIKATLFRTKEHQCWLKYRELAAEVNELALEKRILESIARAAGELIQ